MLQKLQLCACSSLLWLTSRNGTTDRSPRCGRPPVNRSHVSLRAHPRLPRPDRAREGVAGPGGGERGGGEGMASTPRGGSGARAAGFDLCHVEVAMIPLPPLALLDGEGPDEPQATRLIGKDPRHPCAASDLRVEA